MGSGAGRKAAQKALTLTMPRGIRGLSNSNLQPGRVILKAYKPQESEGQGAVNSANLKLPAKLREVRIFITQ